MAADDPTGLLGSVVQPAVLLDGLRVLEVGTFLAVPFAGRLLAGMGARVTRIKDPADPVHRLRGGSDVSLHAFLHEGKESIDGPVDKQALDRLAVEADLTLADVRCLPESWRPPAGALVSVLEPIPDAGDPLADGHLACAMAAVSIAMGEVGRAPLSMPGHTAELAMGLVHAGAALALVCGGLEGRWETSGVTVLSSFVEQNSTSYRLSGIGWRREGRRAAGCAGIYPYGLYACRDGQVALIARSRRDWRDIATALGATQVWERHPDPFLIAAESADEVDQELAPFLQRLTREEVLRQAEERGVLAVPVADTEDVLGYDHLVERGFWQDLGGQRVPGLPFMLVGGGAS